jgi:hypothetical protein
MRLMMLIGVSLVSKVWVIKNPPDLLGSGGLE